MTPLGAQAPVVTPTVDAPIAAAPSVATAPDATLLVATLSPQGFGSGPFATPSSASGASGAALVGLLVAQARADLVHADSSLKRMLVTRIRVLDSLINGLLRGWRLSRQGVGVLIGHALRVGAAVNALVGATWTPALGDATAQATWGAAAPSAAAGAARLRAPGRPAHGGQSAAAGSARVPVQAPVVAPPVPDRSPIGGTSAGAGSAGGTAAPPALLLVATLSIAICGLLSRRRDLDLAPWRSVMLVARLERPG
ncbi:MAG: hypothetical protein ABSG43_15855 [Solirubrobacteraceae bacterium]